MEIIAEGDIWQIKESARFEIGEKEEYKIPLEATEQWKEIFKLLSFEIKHYRGRIRFHQRKIDNQHKWNFFWGIWNFCRKNAIYIYNYKCYIWKLIFPNIIKLDTNLNPIISEKFLYIFSGVDICPFLLLSEDWYIQAYMPTHKVPPSESAQGAGLLELHVDDMVVINM